MPIEELPIDVGIPVPRGALKYDARIAWEKMKDGHSVFVPLVEGYNRKVEQSKLLQAARVRGLRVTTRSAPDGIRIWLRERLAPPRGRGGVRR